MRIHHILNQVLSSNNLKTWSEDQEFAIYLAKKGLKQNGVTLII